MLHNPCTLIRISRRMKSHWRKACSIVGFLLVLSGGHISAIAEGDSLFCYDPNDRCSEVPCPCEGPCQGDPHCPPGYVCRIEPIGPSGCICTTWTGQPEWVTSDDFVGRCEPVPEPTGPRGYTIIDLGTIGGPSAAARAINNKGQIVGVSNTGAGSHPFLWEVGLMIDLSPGFPGYPEALVDINESGQVAFNNRHAEGTYLWEDGLPLTTIGNGRERPISINDLGQVLLGDRIWQNGTSVEISSLSDPPMRADVLNNHGHLGGIFGSFDEPHLGLMVDWELFDLANLASNRARASVRDMNDLAQMVVRDDDPDIEFLSLSFLWTGEELVNVSDVTGCSGLSVGAWKINNCGEMLTVVSQGSSCSHTGWATGGYYSPVTGHRPLETMIEASFRWYLLAATDINDRGQIVGSGRVYVPELGWRQRAFLMSPVPGDLNLDGAIDLNDYVYFFERFGTETADYSVYCNRADLNHDGLTDLADFAEFQRLFTGSQ